MADDFQLRVYCYLDRTQPQYASFVGTVTQGDLMVEGMASLYIEVAPGNEVFRLVDIAVKATEARPGAQVVEREFGMFEIHSHSQQAVIEAGAMGIPCVASNSPGLRESVCHEDTGLLVPHGDVPALANAVTRLLEEDDLWSRMGERAIEWAAEYNWDRSAAETLALAEEAIAEWKCRR